MKEYITLEEFISFANGESKIELTENEINKVKRGRKILEDLLAKNQLVYGANTEVGGLFNKKSSPENEEVRERNLILSHAAGVGEILSIEESRGMLFLLINMLRKGYSGIRWETLQFLINLFNKNIIPAIPEQGSVGASGDLVPLSHLVLLLIGEGNVIQNSRITPFREISKKENIKPVKLKIGEAISLINGTHLMTSVLAHSVERAEILSKIADIAAALSFCALRGNTEVFKQELHQLRSHPGQLASAQNLCSLLRGENYDPRFLQDGYSLRCIAQVHGAVKETISFAREKVEVEINSITGNPIFLPDGKVIHGGNFHGQPLSMVADFLGIALTTLTNISERRIERLLNTHLSGLPPFLVGENGSGLMIAQYTAASLVSENKALAHPASVDSISVSAEQEDFVSMGAWAARKVRQICRNAEYVVAIEILCTLKALDFLDLRPDSVLEKIKNIIKDFLPDLSDGKPLAENIYAVFSLIHDQGEELNRRIDLIINEKKS